MNMPSREDLLGLVDMLAQINQRLDRIEAQLANGKKKKSKKKRPARTKQPPGDEKRDE